MISKQYQKIKTTDFLYYFYSHLPCWWVSSVDYSYRQGGGHLWFILTFPSCNQNNKKVIHISVFTYAILIVFTSHLEIGCDVTGLKCLTVHKKSFRSSFLISYERFKCIAMTLLGSILFCCVQSKAQKF